jgi:hypothetical protein
LLTSANAAERGQAGRNSEFQRRFVADYADCAVVDLDLVNARLTLGLAKRDSAGGEILPKAAKFLDCLGFDCRRATRSGDKAAERSR